MLQMCYVRWLSGMVSGDTHHHCLAGEATRVSKAHFSAAFASSGQVSILPPTWSDKSLRVGLSDARCLRPSLSPFLLLFLWQGAGALRHLG